VSEPEFDVPEHPVVRDKRRIDPVTGEVREPAAQAAAPTPGELSDSHDGSPAGGVGQVEGRAAELEAQLAERTADLQRVQAEYANYRRRVDRDRQAVAEQALASVLVGLLPVLDDIDRARAHGESSQGFTTLAEGLDATLTKLGLERFGSAGEPFDPTVHEALTHAGSSAEVETSTCAEIYQPGYRVGERILRPARVAVVDPETPAPADTTDTTTTPEGSNGSE
jgi:molecular chaperone GrpE